MVVRRFFDQMLPTVLVTHSVVDGYTGAKIVLPEKFETLAFQMGKLHRGQIRDFQSFRTQFQAQIGVFKITDQVPGVPSAYAVEITSAYGQAGTGDGRNYSELMGGVERGIKSHERVVVNPYAEFFAAHELHTGMLN